MPLVNVHYHFEKDQVIDTIYQLTFGGKEANLNADRQSPNVFEGIVKEVYVTSKIEVAVELGGVKFSNWSLKVQVTKLVRDGNNPDGTKRYKEKGTLLDIEKDPVTGQLNQDGYSWATNLYTIK